MLRRAMNKSFIKVKNKCILGSMRRFRRKKNSLTDFFWKSMVRRKIFDNNNATVSSFRGCYGLRLLSQSPSSCVSGTDVIGLVSSSAVTIGRSLSSLCEVTNSEVFLSSIAASIMGVSLNSSDFMLISVKEPKGTIFRILPNNSGCTVNTAIAD